MNKPNCIGPRCAACQLPGVAILNAHLANGQMSLQKLSDRYGISPKGLWRHARNHLPPGVTMARKRGPRGTKYGRPSQREMEA